MDLISGTFDTTNALSAMFLWLIFGLMSTMVNCDIQRFMGNQQYLFHTFGFIAFVFLFTLLDSNNKTSIWVIWLKSIVVYVLVILMTKSKWYFVVPVLVLLLADQSIKKELAFRKDSGKDVKALEAFQTSASRVINIVVVVLIVLGTMHYAVLQKLEYGDDFDIGTFLLAVPQCKDVGTISPPSPPPPPKIQ
jgi:hypothetical protein